MKFITAILGEKIWSVSELEFLAFCVQSGVPRLRRTTMFKSALESTDPDAWKNSDFWGMVEKGPHRAQEGRNFCEKIFFFNN